MEQAQHDYLFDGFGRIRKHDIGKVNFKAHAQLYGAIELDKPIEIRMEQHFSIFFLKHLLPPERVGAEGQRVGDGIADMSVHDLSVFVKQHLETIGKEGCSGALRPGLDFGRGSRRLLGLPRNPQAALCRKLTCEGFPRAFFSGFDLGSRQGICIGEGFPVGLAGGFFGIREQRLVVVHQDIVGVGPQPKLLFASCKVFKSRFEAGREEQDWQAVVPVFGEPGQVQSFVVQGFQGSFEGCPGIFYSFQLGGSGGIQLLRRKFVACFRRALLLEPGGVQRLLCIGDLLPQGAYFFQVFLIRHGQKCSVIRNRIVNAKWF